MNIRHPLTPLEWGLILLLAVLWSGSFIFVGVAVRELPTFSIVALRLALSAAIFFVGFTLLRRKLPRGRQAWTALVAMGITNNALPFCLIAFAQSEIDSGLAAILNATSPLITLVAAHFLTHDEKLTVNGVLGMLIGLAGVLVMIGPEALAGIGFGRELLAELAMLGAATCYALSSIYARRFSRMGITPDRAAAGQIIVAAVIMVPIALIVDRPWTLPMPSSATWLSLLALAVLSTVLAYVVFYRILATAGATRLMFVTLLIPPMALILGALLLSETVTVAEVAGLVLIALGLATIDGRLWGMLRRSLVAPD